MGGAEGGFLGATLRRATHAAFGGLDARRRNAFNAALEKAMLRRGHAATLTAEIGKRVKHLPPARAFAQAVAATIPAIGVVK